MIFFLIRSQFYFEFQFLKKLLDDRKAGVESVEESGKKLKSSLIPKEQKEIEKQVAELQARWDNLVSSSNKRMELLEKLTGVAKDFQDCYDPLLAWLDSEENKISSIKTNAQDVDSMERSIAVLKVIYFEKSFVNVYCLRYWIFLLFNEIIFIFIVGT